MSNTKTVMGQAANTQGIPLDITDVFSTYLYTGNGSTQTITNGIDLAGEGGLVWFKARNDSGTTYPHALFDTERGANNWISSDSTAAEVADNNALNDFNADGFDLGPDSRVNASKDYASWTFRKAPKFFDVVTWTGDGTDNRQIAHDLNGTVGFMVTKKTSSSGDWWCYHRQLGDTSGMRLSSTEAVNTTLTSYPWDVTDTTFKVHDNYINTNDLGATYVAYLFAHNDGDGEFGPDGDQDIIKCGSYTGNGSTDGPEIDLGFEPQWVMFKRATGGTGSWIMSDNMRGVATGGNDAYLQANLTNAEAGTFDSVDFTSRGFKLKTAFTSWNNSGDTYIYMAIRRGPLAQPESGTEVFDMSYWGEGDPDTSPKYESTTMSYVDMGISTNTAGSNKKVGDRLRQGKELITNLTNSEANEANHNFDYQGGYFTGTGTSTNNRAWMWKRAPSFFDVVAYTGDGVAGRTVSHNLGVAPEMMWVRKRSSASLWRVYHKGLNGGTNPEQYGINLNETAAEYDLDTLWNDTAPTASVFTLGIQGNVNGSGSPYIAYLFASLPGISKVGSYTGNGTSQTIDCGFTSGARFVLLKRTDSTGDWFVFDATRGITVGSSDPILYLNSTTQEYAEYYWDPIGADMIQPHSSGFKLVQSSLTNNSTGSYIFYAIA